MKAKLSNGELHAMLNRLLALRPRCLCRVCRSRHAPLPRVVRGCANCTPGERVRVWATGLAHEGEVTGVELAMDVYDIGVNILYDGEQITVNERLGSFEWELLGGTGGGEAAVGEAGAGEGDGVLRSGRLRERLRER